MTKSLLLAAAVVGGACLGCAPAAFAQSSGINPLGLDYGPLHPPVPPQVTTYYPPRHAPAVHHHAHHRVRKAR